MSISERETEKIVRKHFEIDQNTHTGLLVEEQNPTSKHLKELLSTASKKGTKKIGKPEFIITSTDHPDTVLVVECKAKLQDHASGDLEDIHKLLSPEKFAVDGVLHYAMHFKDCYEVIAVAVSGTDPNNYKVSSYIWHKGADNPEILKDANGVEIKILLPFTELIALLQFDPNKKKGDKDALVTFSHSLHDDLRVHAKLTEEKKPLLISAILIALHEDAFAKTWAKATAKELPKRIAHAIEDVLQKASIPDDRRNLMIAEYNFITTASYLNREKKDGRSPLYTITQQMAEHVKPFIAKYAEYDIIGGFYGEFLRYSAGDGKGLGIILTPHHITELFAELADIGSGHTVIDPCAGTGGFLIAAMARMLRAAPNNEIREHIKRYQLCGIEDSANMFTLASSNMLLRGDGKSNILRGSCFEEALQELLINPSDTQQKRPNIGLINPPYSQEDYSELEFVDNMLDMLDTSGNSIGIAIVPMSCAIGSLEEKTSIMKKHTLLASMSMPNDLFTGAATVTCILIFQAHRPHASTDNTWFGYWKKDGFIKAKRAGRIDKRNTWKSIRTGWVEAYRNKRVVAGSSALAMVSDKDDWSAEAYLYPDFDNITKEVYCMYLADYLQYKIRNSIRTAYPTDIGANRG
jgi:type I restriction-modification system DNA methylase subunit